jgi:hypothetical protein
MVLENNFTCLEEIYMLVVPPESTEVLTPSVIKYELEKWVTVTKLFFECRDE